MNRVAKWVGPLVFALCGAATANAQTYTIDFYDSSSTSVIDATGAFTYNAALPADSQFSNFTVNWSGNTFNFTSLANSTPVEAHGCGGGNISFFAYLTSTACSSQSASWLGEFQPSTASSLFIFSASDNPVESGASASGLVIPETGMFKVTTGSIVQTPELDPAFAASGLTLLLGSLMVLRGRKRRHLAA
jgi:hypothetical protein